MWRYVSTFWSMFWEWVDWGLTWLTQWVDSLSFFQLALVAAAVVAFGTMLLRGFGSRSSY